MKLAVLAILLLAAPTLAWADCDSAKAEFFRANDAQDRAYAATTANEKAEGENHSLVCRPESIARQEAYLAALTASVSAQTAVQNACAFPADTVAELQSAHSETEASRVHLRALLAERKDLCSR